MKKDSSNTFIVAGGSAGAGLVLLVLITCLVIVIVRRHRNKKEEETVPEYEDVSCYQSKNPYYGHNLSPLTTDDSKINLDCENVSGLCKHEHENEKRPEDEISTDIPNETKVDLHQVYVLDA